MKEVAISSYKRANDSSGGSSGGGFIDISSKLDKSIWDAEFEVLDDYLRAKRTMLFSGNVVVENFEAGGGGADLPLGVLGDVLYHDGVDWVAKNISTLGLATQSWVTQQGYVANNDARLSDARPASDVHAWAKAATKPTYTATEVGADMGGRLSITTEKPNYGDYMLFNQIPEGEDDSYPYGWQNVIRMLHPNQAGFWTEIATSFTGSEEMHYRCMTWSGVQPWRRVWHNGNSNNPYADWTMQRGFIGNPTSPHYDRGDAWLIINGTPNAKRAGIEMHGEDPDTITVLQQVDGTTYLRSSSLNGRNIKGRILYDAGMHQFTGDVVFMGQVALNNF